MEEIFKLKQQCRKDMALLEKRYSPTLLYDLSKDALKLLEDVPAFRKADSFAIYHAMPFEVQTADFIKKWSASKTIYLPVICGNCLQLHPYKNDNALKSGVFGILEPIPDENAEKPRPDLIIVPGVAFDRQMNRLGRGKGYYDKLLAEPGLKDVTRIGLCFSYQIVPEVPVSPNDVKLDGIVTEREYIVAKKD